MRRTTIVHRRGRAQISCTLSLYGITRPSERRWRVLPQGGSVLVFDVVRLSAPVPWLSGRASASHAEGRWFDPSRDHPSGLHEHGCARCDRYTHDPWCVYGYCLALPTQCRRRKTRVPTRSGGARNTQDTSKLAQLCLPAGPRAVPSPDVNFALVHSAWLGAGSWELITPLLGRAGHQVVTRRQHHSAGRGKGPVGALRVSCLVLAPAQTHCSAGKIVRLISPPPASPPRRYRGR